MEEWRNRAMEKLKDLKADLQRVKELDCRLFEQHLISESDRVVFRKALDTIKEEIEGIQFDLALDDMLASGDLPLEDFLEKFKNTDPKFD